MLQRVCLCGSLLVFTACGWAQGTRHFIFRYGFTVNNIPAGEKVRIWFPKAHSDEFQEVKVISATGDLPLKKTHESEYGNEMYYSAASKARQANLHFEVVYDVVRHERLVLGRIVPHLEAATLDKKETRRDLQAYRLVPVTGLPAELAAKAVEGRTTTLEKARAIYDYVFDNMRYDKSGAGWGRGDVLYACSAKHGNCTDFHSLFISMARSQGIPARFEIGFAIPPDKHAGEVAGYHCWADFFDPAHGWVPVDISEAWLSPVKKDYYFGAHDDNRVQFSMGRDLILSPKQGGEPLNYFIYPYVEVAGKAHPNVSLAFSFADAGAAVAAK
jgi:transglutaminase-like putative cysteine protease